MSKLIDNGFESSRLYSIVFQSLFFLMISTSVGKVFADVKPMIAAGGHYTLALKQDGTVWGWGKNSSGQLGDGTKINRAIPVSVNDLDGVISIAAGESHSLALKDDGTVWAWGWGETNLATDSDISQSSIPVKVSDLEDVVAISVGSDYFPSGFSEGWSYSVALKSDGTVWAWGDNSSCQLGLCHSITASDTPLKINGLTDIAQISAGENHVLALSNDGSVWAWGDNRYGELGDSVKYESYIPVKVSGLTNIVAVATGKHSSLALKEDGTVWVWGDNHDGQLGINSNVEFKNIPTKIESIDGIVAISARFKHVLALKNTGEVLVWGNNLLNDDYEIWNSPKPILAKGLSNIVSIAAGSLTNYAFDVDGTVWSWGGNGFGQIGNDSVSYRSYPLEVKNFTGVDVVKAGYDHTLALKEDGTVWGFGHNGYGQLGNNSFLGDTKPVQAIIENVADIAPGAYHSLALKSDGTVWAWGKNENGQLGDGSLVNSSVPMQVIGLDNCVAITAGYDYSMALRNDGSIWVWGNNKYGQLGDGSYDQKLIPVQLDGVNDVISIAAGKNHSLAVKSDGSIWAWGPNAWDKRGVDGDPSTPLQINDLSDFNLVEAGADHSIAQHSDGSVWAWGYGYGEAKDSEIQINDTCNVALISTRYLHNLALCDDGAVWTWGIYYNKQIIVGESSLDWTPVQVLGLTDIKAVAAGFDFSAAVTDDGRIFTWGENDRGQLGNGQLTVNPTRALINLKNSIPTISVLNPLIESEINSNATIVSKVSAAVGREISYVVFEANGAYFEDDSYPYEYGFNTAQLGLGIHSFTVTAYDDIGQASLPAVSDVKIIECENCEINADPTVTIIAPTELSVEKGESVIIGAIAQADTGLSIEKVTFDGVGTNNDVFSALYHYVFDTSDIDVGTYVFTVTATDNLGNTSVSETLSLEVVKKSDDGEVDVSESNESGGGGGGSMPLIMLILLAPFVRRRK